MIFDIQKFLNHPHVLAKRREGLVIFNYDLTCTYEKCWDEVTLQSRGFILEEATGKVIFRNMRKFFNLNETEETKLENLPDLPFIATEKMDGYMGCAYQWRDLWHVSTRGSFESEMAQWATPWFRANVHTEAMDPDYSYHFEIIYNLKIVISYDFEGMVLLTAVHKETGKEMPYEQLVQDAKGMGVRVAPLLPKFDSLIKLAEYVKGLPSNREGCVVTFSNGLKVKIKGEEYCRVHKIISRMTPIAFWEVYDPNTGHIPVEYLHTVPEEFRDTSDAIVAAIEGAIEKSLAEVGVAFKKVEESLPAGADDKTFALKTKEMYPKMLGWIMSYRSGNFPHLRATLHRKHRPKSNQLDIPGYGRIKEDG